MLSKPKYKLCKRLGGIYEKCQSQSYAISEAKYRKRVRRRPASDYGKQLLEKQKLRFAYGITEKQLRRYVYEAMKAQDTAQALHEVLETRLDNIVYKLGFAPTRRAARQMVTHGHIIVNDRKVKIPSFKVSVGDKVAVREQSKARTMFAQLMETIKKYKTPEWLKLDDKKLEGELKSKPVYDPAQSMFDLSLVFEFYTR